MIPGNIIYKQRGTIWHSGENTILGRDHTIHAAVAGFVQYYRDPAKHPTRQYIGVTFNRDDTLPYPPHAVRRRKLGMITVPRRMPTESPELSPSGIPSLVIRREGFVDLPAAPEAADTAATVQIEEYASAAREAAEGQRETVAPPSAEEPKQQATGALAEPNAEEQRIRNMMQLKSTRVLHLTKNYGYRRAIGQLVA